jgi:release factor glutamine methyltransferase
LDLGTGSGILGITLAAEQPNAVVVATDISEPALAVAQKNAQIHQVKDRIRFVQADWFNGVSGEFDLIISNPPYIAENELNGLDRDVMDFDPMIALTPGGDGLAPYRIIAKQARTYLCKTGRVIVEIGYLQGSDVTQMFVDAGFANVQILRDLEGKDRAISAENPI